MRVEVLCGLTDWCGIGFGKCRWAVRNGCGETDNGYGFACHHGQQWGDRNKKNKNDTIMTADVMYVTCRIVSIVNQCTNFS